MAGGISFLFICIVFRCFYALDLICPIELQMEGVGRLSAKDNEQTCQGCWVRKTSKNARGASYGKVSGGNMGVTAGNFWWRNLWAARMFFAVEWK